MADNGENTGILFRLRNAATRWLGKPAADERGAMRKTTTTIIQAASRAGGMNGQDFALSYEDAEASSTRVLTSAEMESLERAELIAHTDRLQQLYTQLESENRFLAWEFREFQDNFTYFSQALKLAHRLNASDVETIATLAVEEIPAYFNCNFAALFFYDVDSRLLTLHRATERFSGDMLAFHRDRDGDNFALKLFFDLSEPAIVECDRDERKMLSDGRILPADVPDIWLDRIGDKALVIPLHVQRAEHGDPLVLGGLLIGDCRQGLQTKDAEVSVIFADLLSSSLYNAMLVQKLNDLTIIEPLTNIYNRRHLINQLNSSMIQARRQGHHLSIAMLDIDNFKIFNDTHGHLCGDEVLRRVAAQIKTSIRTEVDIPARYGGEEFLIIMPFTSLEAAYNVAERIRKSIKTNACMFEGKCLYVTCSLGLAEYSPGEDLESFIERADSALYQAKRAGRDQVCAAPPPPASGE